MVSIDWSNEGGFYKDFGRVDGVLEDVKERQRLSSVSMLSYRKGDG
ncbi:hypothetical protein HMPREF9442_01816 [Paraprevotella xylaniphila YIT 11841]|uniref:Uncharacterized protein n=1 Tax=Paraprevotella xylaniphila YIT 11841 TaxID=762982 RepID=F3QUE6_9BACT|nr:hypothetical protein HMPREF9442_01816 [Paraprevotella xylaniphila YIT 11841]